MKTTEVVITPKVAAAMLAKNSINRPLSRERVDRLASELRSGRWRENGETVKVAKDGALLDGQHRLSAVVESNIPVRVLVVEGLDMAAFDTIDTGKPRNVADTLAANGTEYHKNTAAALRAFVDVVKGGKKGFPVTNRQALDLLTATPGLATSTKWAHHMHKGVGRSMPTSIISALHYMFSCADKQMADTFWSRFADGIGLSKKDPVYLLRERIVSSGMGSRLSRREKMALSIKAWNATRTGLVVKQLKWIDGVEEFPTVNGFKDSITI